MFGNATKKDSRYTLPSFLHCVLNTAMAYDIGRYEFIGVIDDDAYFLNPIEAVETMLDGFQAEPKLGQTGPMGGLRKKWRYEGNCAFVEYLKGSPWTTLGCQVYRREALESLGDISWLRRLYFRADSLLALTLHMHGWGVGEQDIRFSHQLSAGLSTQFATVQHHKMMLYYGKNDFDAVYPDVLRSYMSDTKTTRERPIEWYKLQTRQIWAAHNKTHNTRITTIENAAHGV